MSKQLRQPAAGDTVATIKTSMGDIKVVLFPDAAPKAVENFTTHAENGYYDGVIFHRVIPDFMIQGGDPLGKGIGGESIWGKPFKDEFSRDYHNLRGALCMANAGPNTNGSQFFIVQAPAVDERFIPRWSVCPICSRTSPLRTTRRSAVLRGSISDIRCSVRCSRAWMLSMR